MSVHDTGLDLFDITALPQVENNGPTKASTANKNAIATKTANNQKVENNSQFSANKSSSEAARYGQSKGFSLRKKSSNPDATDSASSKKTSTRSSNVKCSASVRPYPEFMCVKGAPDVLISKCSHFVVTCKGGKGHRMLPVDAAFNSCVTAAFEEMASQVIFHISLKHSLLLRYI